MNNRKSAGLASKIQGHLFESKLAQSLGSDFIQYDSGSNKSDLMSKDGRFKISLKNSEKSHTQVALISQKTLSNYLNLNNNSVNFVTMFFGFGDGTCLNQNKISKYNLKINILDEDEEINRNRLLFKNIPEIHSSSFMDQLNDKSANSDFYERIVGGQANVLAWTKLKNDVNSVEFASMSDIIQLLRKGTWRASFQSSTLELILNGKRLMYVQMKGSSKRFSPGYHSCMFHLYRDVMNEVSSFANINTVAI
jgi:hypothetical protein